MRNIVETFVWCKLPAERDEKLREIIGESESTDIWCPMAIDFSKVDAIKMSAFDEFVGEEKAVVYLPYDSFTINMSYWEALEIWRKP